MTDRHQAHQTPEGETVRGVIPIIFVTAHKNRGGAGEGAFSDTTLLSAIETTLRTR